MHIRHSNPNRHRCANRDSKRRSGVVTLELILFLPVFVIGLVAIIEYGIIMQGIKAVEFSAREGARQAARTAGYGANDPTVPQATVIKTKVDRALSTIGMLATSTSGITSAGVTLRHNEFTAGNGASATSGTCDADPTTPALPANSVRVTVCVNLADITPNLLSGFGFSISTYTVEATSTFAYEL